jgi:hypothetical protein|tara:strand:+ start:12865 stop:14049 length:1185 start_codon:yes stop_codon:yes gene_type:complete
MKNMARNYVRTVTDMERYYYGAGNSMGYTYTGSELLKADSPMLSTTAGTYQAIYGRKVWSQLNQEFNAFSILPKKPWERSGWRVITEKPNSGAVHGGIAENGTLPETVKPTFQHVAAKPKTIAHSFDVSEVAVFLADKDDGLGDMRSVLKEEMGKHHAEMVNKMLLTDCSTAAGNNFESLDRITAAEASNGAGSATTLKTTSSNNHADDGDLDIYSIDRRDNAWASAEVNCAADTTAGNKRVLSLDHLDTIFQQVWERGGNPKVILTGYDTLMRLQQLLQAQQRFMEEKRVTPTYNGVKGVPGIEAGFIVATYNGVPIIPSKDVVKTDGLSRMYLLDTDYMYFSTAIPTQYFESGIETGDPFAINRLGQEGLYRTMGEVWTTFFGAQASIRDLK